MGYRYILPMGQNKFFVAPTDPLPHGFPSRGSCRQTAAPLTLKKRNQGKSLQSEQRLISFIFAAFFQQRNEK